MRFLKGKMIGFLWDVYRGTMFGTRSPSSLLFHFPTMSEVTEASSSQWDKYTALPLPADFSHKKPFDSLAIWPESKNVSIKEAQIRSGVAPSLGQGPWMVVIVDFTKVVSSDPLDKLKHILLFLTSIPLQLSPKEILCILAGQWVEDCMAEQMINDIHISTWIRHRYGFCAVLLR